MTILPPHTASQVRNAALSALHFIAYEHQCEVPDILALVTGQIQSVSGPDTVILTNLGTAPDPTPSQPPSQAPAARMSDQPSSDMQAEGSPQPSATPSSEPADSSGNPTRTLAKREAEASTDAGRVQDRCESTPPNPSPAKPPSRREKLRALVAEHPDWTAKELAFAMGIGEDNVRSIAGQISLKLPKASTKAERKKAATTAALKAAPAKPQAPVERAGLPMPRSEAPPPPVATATKRVTLADQIRAHLVDHPDATARDIADAAGKTIQSIGWAAQQAGIVLRKYTAEERSAASARGAKAKAKSAETAPQTPPRPPVEADASDVLHRVKKAPSGRFYLRDKTTLEFVHQSLAPSPNGSGPMMTKDRKWAWYDTMQRYRGAKKRWPELADMRKEAVAK